MSSSACRRVAAAAALAAGLACGEPGERASGPPSQAAEAPAPAVPAAQTSRTLPEPGQATVEATHGKVTLLANQVERERVLEQLGAAAGFEVRLHFAFRTGELVTVQAFDESPERAVALVLAGVPHQLRYEVDAASGRHVLRQVVAGWGVQRQGPLTREAADRRQEQRIRLREQMRERLAARSARQAEVPPEERARRRAEREASRARLKEAKPGAPSESDLLRDLESDDPRVRLDAVEQLVPDAASRIERLGQIALEDPDPAVRAAAAEQLGDSDAATAVQALLGALDDSEPSVVIAALSALEWIGDESITPRIQPLLAHRHPAVREAAAEAIRMLE